MAVSLRNTSLFGDASLVSYWEMEGNSSDSKDSNTGTDTAITYNSGNGKFTQGAGLNGTTSNISLGNPSNLKITGNWTISAWIRTSNDGSIIEIWSWDGSKRGGIHLAINGSLEIESAKNTGNVLGTDYQTCSGGSVKDGIFHHVVGTWDGSNLRAYVDSALVNTVAWANAAAYQTNPFYIGARYFSGSINSNFNGAIDDVAVFSRALSASEIALLFNGPASLPTGLTILIEV